MIDEENKKENKLPNINHTSDKMSVILDKLHKTESEKENIESLHLKLLSENNVLHQKLKNLEKLFLASSGHGKNDSI